MVDLDFAAAARSLVDHLFDLGHRDVVLVSPPRHVFDRGGAYSWRFRDAALLRASEIGLRLTRWTTAGAGLNTHLRATAENALSAPQ